MHRKRVALIYGALCHTIFACAVLAMVVQMYLGMSHGFGAVPYPYAWAVNLALLLQFPVLHSLLLTRPGMKRIATIEPLGYGRTLAVTTYTIVASVQLIALFTLWTPTGVIWWQAEGWVLWLWTGLYAVPWLMLMKSNLDAGVEVQSGLIGWTSLYRGVRPIFPDMPEDGLFRLVRQPIYVSFALTTWLVPTWTPDQLMVASGLTAYCVLGPLHKERRFARTFGPRFEAYRARVPYWLPLPRRDRGRNQGRDAPDTN